MRCFSAHVGHLVCPGMAGCWPSLQGPCSLSLLRFSVARARARSCRSSGVRRTRFGFCRRSVLSCLCLVWQESKNEARLMSGLAFATICSDPDPPFSWPACRRRSSGGTPGAVRRRYRTWSGPESICCCSSGTSRVLWLSAFSFVVFSCGSLDAPGVAPGDVRSPDDL